MKETHTKATREAEASQLPMPGPFPKRGFKGFYKGSFKASYKGFYKGSFSVGFLYKLYKS